MEGDFDIPELKWWEIVLVVLYFYPMVIKEAIVGFFRRVFGKR